LSFPIFAGKCSDQCYPYGPDDCDNPKYDWDSTEPICAWGLTFTNQAEAACSGMPKTFASQCWQKGVCKYGVRGDKIVTEFITPKGTGGTVEAAVKDTSPPSKTNAPYSYSEALTKSLLFYDSMISGKFAKEHKRLTWRADSCQECYNTRYKKDLSGGFYEAGGSYLKFPLINAYMTVMLAWEGIEEGPALNKSGVLPDLRWKVKWAADYLMACHVAPYVYVGLNGNDTMDFDYFGPPELYNKHVRARPFGYITKDANKKGSEVLADSAAALAAASFLLRDKVKWSELALKEAEFLYEWARTSPGSYMDNKDPVMKIHANLYSSQGYNDELAWAALWLYKVTGKSAYLDQAKGYYAKTKFDVETDTFELNNKRPALSILMGKSTEQKYRDDANAYFDFLLDTKKAIYTKKGLYYPYHWGAARHGANAAWLALVYAKNEKVPAAYANRLRNFAHFQVNYLLGDSGRSWIVGFGKQPYPIFQWHKASYNDYLDWNPAMADKIYAMPVVGPWSSGFLGANAPFVEKGKLDFEGSRRPQRRIAYGLLMSPLFNDNQVASRKDYTYTEPTLEYPAGLVGALASMSGWYGQGPYTAKMVDVLPFKG
jgi:endoglucanase